MYIKIIRKYCKAEKTTHNYYRLCESYRDEWGFPRQRMVLGLGRLLEIPDIDQKVLFLERLNELIKGTPTLFNSCIDEKVEQLAQHYYREIKSKKKIDRVSTASEEFDLIDLKTLKNKNIRDVGAESMCFLAFRQLKIDRYLIGRGWSEEQINLAATHVISRVVYPASEYKTVSWIKENSAICELTGYDIEKVTKDKLYGISRELYKEKDGLENHLSRCTNELFNLENKIILYDLTNTYFEGRMKDSRMAKFGRLKEKYASVHKYYEITVLDKGNSIATGLVFERKGESPAEEKAGIYFLRTSLNSKDEQTLWTIYNAIREIEYTFRVLKTDLDLRPIFHKTDDASMAHLYLGLLAYWIVSTIRYQLKQQGLHHDWSEIIRIMNTQKSVTTIVKNNKEETIQIRQCSEPTEQVKQICDKLKYALIPFPRKKSVWHPGEILKTPKPDYQLVTDR